METPTWAVFCCTKSSEYQVYAVYETEIAAKYGARAMAADYQGATYYVAQIVYSYKFKPAQVVETEIVHLDIQKVFTSWQWKILYWPEKTDETI